ncbi:MAG: hypothetical protein EON97_00100 [Chitinophagaceae bacterium]|nr:MAG: hypothetical protein EON97_00100 [Chitinophagaceae bacterium]
MDLLEAFEQWNEYIFKAQRENDLEDLYDLEINGHSTSSFLSDVLRRKQPVHPLPYSDFKIHDEFLVISKDLKYVTGILFCLRPYIVDTEALGGRYFQNLPDRRYLIYCSFGLQLVYNFWDRVGDILHYYFPSKMKPDGVYFGRMKEVIDPTYKVSQPYQKLVDLYKEVEHLLHLRHVTTHHFQIETKHYWGTIEHSDNTEERKIINAEKFAYPEKFKRALEIFREAFTQSLFLIDLLPDKPPHTESDDN